MERNKIIAVVALLFIAGLAILQKDPFKSDEPSPTPPPPGQKPKPTPIPADLAAKLKIQDQKVGTGPAADFGDQLKVEYTGKLTDGQVFDSSRGREPFDVTLGAGQVIAGWDSGLRGMKKGGKRRITIPPELGYGANAQNKIPANSTLIFDVELLDLKKAK